MSIHKPRLVVLSVIGLAALSGLLIGASSRTAEAKRPTTFTEASLYGAYGAEEQGDGHVSAGLGVVVYDGRGRTHRRIRVNAPDGNGGRRLIEFEGDGWYQVEADGTGTATFENVLSDGSVTTDVFDFVILESSGASQRGRGASLAKELFAVQRQAGVTVSLVTSRQTRQSDP